MGIVLARGGFNASLIVVFHPGAIKHGNGPTHRDIVSSKYDPPPSRMALEVVLLDIFLNC